MFMYWPPVIIQVSTYINVSIRTICNCGDPVKSQAIDL